MDGGNAGIEGIIFPAMANDLLYDLFPAPLVANIMARYTAFCFSAILCIFASPRLRATASNMACHNNVFSTICPDRYFQGIDVT